MTTRFVDSAATYVTGLTEADAHKSITAATVGAAALWAAGDVIKCASTHNETTGIGSAGARSITLPTTLGLQIISVTFNGAGTGALTPGATIDVGASSNACSVVSGFGYINGLTFAGGTNASGNCDVFVASSTVASGMIFDACTFSQPANAASEFGIGPTVSIHNAKVRFVNCIYSCGGANTAKVINLYRGEISFEGLTLTGTAQATLFAFNSAGHVRASVVGSDLSGMAITTAIISVSATTPSSIVFSGCKLNYSGSLTTGTVPIDAGPVVEFIDCAEVSDDTNINYVKVCSQGIITAGNAVYEGAMPMSYFMAPNANVSLGNPLRTPPIGKYNTTLSAMTPYIPVAHNAVGAGGSGHLQNNQAWAEFWIKATSGVPLLTVDRSDRVADVLTAAADQTTDGTSSWTGSGVGTKDKLAPASAFTPAENGFLSAVVCLAADIDIYVSPKMRT